jgi:hypothetical protein
MNELKKRIIRLINKCSDINLLMVIYELLQ